MRKIILLTACIDPRGMSNTYITDIEERKMQYVNALNFYINKTDLDIVLVENSGNDISSSFEKQINENRLEILTYKSDDANRYRGKGFGEAEIIEYAINHSDKIIESCTLIKITGRLIVENIKKIINFYSFFLSRNTIQCNMNSDFSFADSKMIIAPVAFYKELIADKYNMDDNKGIYFEHILAKTIKEQSYFYYAFYFIDIILIGHSGSTGEKYAKESKNTKVKNLYLLWITKKTLIYEYEFSKKKHNRIYRMVIFSIYICTAFVNKILNI